MRILVVDDDTVFCTVANKRLGALDMRVTEAHDGLSAWTTVQSEDFDLALIDLGLPGLDGLALIEHIRELPKTQHLPIMVVTGRDDRASVDAAFAAGATFFLTKPINWFLIEHQIRCVMRLTTSEMALRVAHERVRADNRIKDTVIGRLNHSLRPLAHDLNRVANDIMDVARSGGAPGTLIAHAGLMISEAASLEAGLTKMTAFAGTMSTAIDLAEMPVTVGDLMDHVAEQALMLAVGCDIALRVDHGISPVPITCDPERLTLAIGNLVDNAIRFAPANSTVTLAARLLDDRSLYISVDDEGCGIDPHHLVLLLSPLLEVDNPGRFDAQLGGMGLATTKHIVEAHGGVLELRSVPNCGTTAVIHLPASRTGVMRQYAHADTYVHTSDAAVGGDALRYA